MWSKTALSLALVVALGALAPSSARATSHSEWRELDTKESILLFSPPFMGNLNPEIWIYVRDRTGSRAEWLCWRNFGSGGANACIAYQKQQRNFQYRTAKDGLTFYRRLKSVQHTIIGESKNVRHELATFDTVMFTHDMSNGKKFCVVFVSYLGGRTRHINGWYCAPVNVPLSEPLVQKMISTIGLKGRYEPPRVTYEGDPSASEAEVSSEPEVVARSTDEISLRKTVSVQDVYDAAKTHCESLGKTSYLISNAVGDGVYTFRCE